MRTHTEQVAQALIAMGLPDMNDYHNWQPGDLIGTAYDGAHPDLYDCTEYTFERITDGCIELSDDSNGFFITIEMAQVLKWLRRP